MGIACLAVPLPWVSPAAGQTPDPNSMTGMLRVRLEKGLTGRSKFYKTGPKEMVLDLIVRDGKWEPTVWGYAPAYRTGDHDGRLAELDADGDSLGLQVKLFVNHDGWNYRRGLATYDIELKADGNSWRGAYKGRFLNEKLGGSASASLERIWPKVVKYDPPKSGEHPRLLFRKKHLEELRKQAATEEGRKIIRNLRSRLYRRIKGGDYTSGYNAAGHALHFLLTGDPNSKELSQKWAHLTLDANPAEHEMYGFLDYFAGLSLAYDLGYHFWDEDLKKTTVAYLAGWSELFTSLRVKIYIANIWLCRDLHPSSKGLAQFRAGAGLMQLAIMGDKGPLTIPPPRKPVPFIEIPATAYKPAEGTPVSKYRSEKMLDDWLFNGPFPSSRDANDLLEDLGGWLQATPAEGTKVKFKGVDFTFRALPEKAVEKSKWTRNQRVVSPPGARDGTVHFLFCALRNDRKRLAYVTAGNPSATMSIAGQVVANGSAVELPEGTLPVMIRFVGDANRLNWLMPMLVDVPRSDEYAVRHGREMHQRQLKRYRRFVEEYKQADGRIQADYHLKILERSAKRYMSYPAKERTARLGDERSATLRSDHLFRLYLKSYRDLCGRDLNGSAPETWKPVDLPGDDLETVCRIVRP